MLRRGMRWRSSTISHPISWHRSLSLEQDILCLARQGLGTGGGDVGSDWSSACVGRVAAPITVNDGSQAGSVIGASSSLGTDEAAGRRGLAVCSASVRGSRRSAVGSPSGRLPSRTPDYPPGRRITHSSSRQITQVGSLVDVLP